MGWNDLQEPIPGSRPELFDRVTTRARWLRQRRQMTWAAAGVVAVLAVAVPAATLVGADRENSTEVASVAPPDSLFGPTLDGLPRDTTPPSLPPPLPFPGTTLAPAPGTPTTVRPGVPPSTAVPTGPAPAPSPAPASATSPPPDPGPAPRPPNCTAADVELTATSDKQSYAPGDPVKLTLSVRNRSDHVCGYNASYQMVPYDASGQRAAVSSMKHVDYPFGDLTQLAPGEVDIATDEWGHYDCPGDMSTCHPEAPGVYSVVFEMVPLGSASANVTLT